MSMFNLKEVSEEIKGGGVNETYIYPGIRNNVIISMWVHGKSSVKGTPFIAVQLVTKEGKAANVEPKQFEFYVSEKAMPDTLARIKHIVTKVATNADWESKEPSDLEEMVDHLNDISRGKVLRMKFTGEEYENAQGVIKEAARIGYPEFAEAIEEGAEYPVVSDKDTKLVFDKDDQHDFKRLPKDSSTVTSNVGIVNKTPASLDWLG